MQFINADHLRSSVWSQRNVSRHVLFPPPFPPVLSWLNGLGHSLGYLLHPALVWETGAFPDVPRYPGLCQQTSCGHLGLLQGRSGQVFLKPLSTATELVLVGFLSVAAGKVFTESPLLTSMSVTLGEKGCDICYKVVRVLWKTNHVCRIKEFNKGTLGTLSHREEKDWIGFQHCRC